jgi:hypothetical protein
LTFTKEVMPCPLRESYSLHITAISMALIGFVNFAKFGKSDHVVASGLLRPSGGSGGSPTSVVLSATNHSIESGQRNTRVRVGVVGKITKQRFTSPQASD